VTKATSTLQDKSNLNILSNESRYYATVSCIYGGALSIMGAGSLAIAALALKGLVGRICLGLPSAGMLLVGGVLSGFGLRLNARIRKAEKAHREGNIQSP
jgi:hypothetical protein